jgi:hypothetical protein
MELLSELKPPVIFGCTLPTRDASGAGLSASLLSPPGKQAHPLDNRDLLACTGKETWSGEVENLHPKMVTAHACTGISLDACT